MKKQIKLLTCLTKPLVLFLLLFALGVGQMWGWANRTYDGSTKLYIMNHAPTGWAENWAAGESTNLYVCLKPQSGSETWYTPTLESGSSMYARGALYSITPPSGTYEYVKLKRTNGKDDSAESGNVTYGIDFSSTTSNNLLKGWNTSNSTGTWDQINPTSVTSDGNGVLYFNMSPGDPTYIDYNFSAEKNYAFFYNNDHGEWSDQAVQVTGNYYKVHVPEGTWTGLILTRHGNVEKPDWSNVYTNGSGQKNQSTDITFTDNHNYISAWYENKYAGAIAATMSNYIPASTFILNGSMNGWNMMTAKYFEGGTLELSLPAKKTYAFKIIEGGDGGSGTWKGLYSSNCITSTMAKWGCSGSENIPINTAGAGTYTFEYNSSDGLSVTYPTTSHPDTNYVYLIDYDWDDPRIHFPYSSTSGVPCNLGGQQLDGLTSPSTITNTVTFNIDSKDKQFFYAAVGEYTKLHFFRYNDNVNKSGEQDPHPGQRLYWNGSAWTWSGIPVFIGLNRKGATDGDSEKWVDFNSTELGESEKIITPTKDYYTFGGYWTEDANGASGSKVIDNEGNWIASVADYTDASKKWIHAGTSTILYAQWIENLHDVDVEVSPAGAGSVQVSGSSISKIEKIGYETHSAVLTAVPTNAAWVFKEWQVTSGAHLDLINYAEGSTTMEITATDDGQKLTAVFEKRYELVGSVYDDSSNGGMPGWNYDGTGDFAINSFTALDTDNGVDLSYLCTLTSNTAYKFKIFDKKDGSYGKNDPTYDYYTLPANTSAELSDYGGGTEDVWIQTGDASGVFKFRITKIRKDGDRYYPTISVDRPQQANFGRRRVDIDGTAHDDNTGGTLVVDTSGTAISTGAWIPYGKTVQYTTAPVSGYTQTWYTSSEYSSTFVAGGIWEHAITSTDNCYAQFTENATTVTLSATNGQIKVGDTPSSSTTCGVTTPRSLTAVPNDGYRFTGWTKTSCTDYDVTSTSTNPTTLSGLGSGASSGQTLTANFALRYSLKGTMNSENWGTDHIVSNIETVGGKAIGYVDITLPANTSYEFAIFDLATSGWLKNGSDQVFYMTNGNSYAWGFGTDKTFNCGITTAGAGTYRFMWNITDKTMSVIYPNFVIYRSGDKDEDSESATHTTTSTVESYDGGTIAQGIEFRMKVRELDKWYTLCLPFEVNKVCVWDAEDGKYYEMKPYYRPTPGGIFYTGHYVIRTPYGENVTGPGIEIELENFDDWRDPVNASVLPLASTPYIIQWHHSYFYNRYISFFGATGQMIQNSMTSVDAPSENDKVRVCGNDAMKKGEVAGAYLLDNDYGSGAWLRDENVETVRTILPFECYIIASGETTGRYLAIRRGMTTDDTPTGWDDVLNSEQKQTITVYTLSGFQVTQYNDCSISQAAQRLRAENSEGIFILRSENESVKLMVGGK